MENLKKLKKYTNSFIDALMPYLKSGFQVSATIHPAAAEGAVIEFKIDEQIRNNVTIVSTVPRINETIKNIDQKLIGGNIQGVTFLGTNLYIDGDRIVVIKGEDVHGHWTNKAVQDDVERVVSPKKRAK